METLTDFATVQYFNVETVTVGVFRIWRGTYDRDAASEIATVVLLFAVMATGLERVLRGRARFGESGGQGAGVEPVQLRGWSGVGGDARCRWRRHGGLPGADSTAGDVGDRRAARPAWHADGGPLRRVPRPQPGAHRRHRRRSCVTASVVVGNARRFSQSPLVGVANRVSIVGYAVPGPVVAMGVVLAVAALDDVLEGGGSRAAGVRRHGLVHRPRLRLFHPLPRAGRRRRGGRSEPDPARDHGVGPLAGSQAPNGARPGPPPARPHERAGRGDPGRRRRVQGAPDRLPPATGRDSTRCRSGSTTSPRSRGSSRPRCRP